MKMQAYFNWNGGTVVRQTDKTITVEIWLKDQRGHAFHVQKKILKSSIKKPGDKSPEGG